jgi:5-methylcytosine-specific restriction enzyme subunit McrC
MTHYKAVKPWCELVLSREQPLAVFGATEGLSLLFPMQKLFECYVAKWLRRRVPPGTVVRAPAASESLCVHDGSPMFQLEPDIYVAQGAKRWVLDAKWKALDGANRTNKYLLSQADIYQLFEYVHRYLRGTGEMALIFPRDGGFREPLAPFDFGGGLMLHALPFDLESDELIGGEKLNLSLRHSGSALHAA